MMPNWFVVNRPGPGGMDPAPAGAPAWFSQAQIIRNYLPAAILNLMCGRFPDK
jgi:hypothetical protein